MNMVVFVVALLTAVASFGIDVVKPGGTGKVGIDLSGFAAAGGRAAEFRQVLENDLALSGWFSGVTVRGAGTFTVSGSCADASGSLRAACVVRDTGRARDLLSKSYRGTSEETRRLAHAMADDIVMAIKNVRGIASTRIVMVGVRGGQKDLYMCDADGQNVVRVTRDGTAARMAPSWYPDANALVYTAYLQQYPDIYRVDIGQLSRERLAAFPGLNAGGAISPDGQEMAMILSRDGNPELYVMNLRSRAVTRLTKTQRATEASPAWSPDGKQIAYVSDASASPQIYVIGRHDGTSQRMTYRGSENVSPDWSRDGRLAFSSKRGGRYIVCVLDPGATEAIPVTEGDADYEDPSWAPDNRHLVCTRSVGYQASIYILDTMKDPPLRLTTREGNWYSAAWSPK